MVTAPIPVAVVTGDAGAGVDRQAAELTRALQADPRLAVVTLAPATKAQERVDEPTSAALLLFEEARRAWTELDAPQVLAKTAQVESLLRPWLVSAEATSLLARALRLRGVAALFLEQPEPAARSFVSAFFLDPGFAPGAEEWPPAARLAYADSVAAARRTAPGALSVRVEPTVVEVWLDGRLVAIGPTTLDQLLPGEHHLTAVCVGHERFAAVVPVSGDGKLEQVEVFLPPVSETEKHGQVTTALLEGFGTPAEGRLVTQAATLLAVSGLVVVAVEPDNDARAAGWALNAAGERLGGRVSLAEPAQAAAELALRIVGGEGPTAVAPPTPWYRRWYTLAAAGGVVAGVGLALLLALPAGDDDRRSLYVGVGK
jgi:hypothetical protein